MKIYIDPGHGGSDPGAIGPSGLEEKSVTLLTAMYLKDVLWDCGHDIALSRDTDRAVSLDARCDDANIKGSDLFISLHCNSAESPQAHGFEVWTSVGNTGADPYASWVFRTIRKYFPEMRGRVDMSDGDEDKEAGFVVLRKTIMPAILVEMAFISNQVEEQMLSMPEFRMRMAAAIAEGVRNVVG